MTPGAQPYLPPAAAPPLPAAGAAVIGLDVVRLAGFTADACLKCNVCNTVCPVARVTDRFPGPKYVGPQAQRFRSDQARSPQSARPQRVPRSPVTPLSLLEPPARPGGPGRQTAPRPLSPDLTVDWCSGCGFCTRACPAGVEIAEINSRARAVLRVQNAAPRLAGVPLRRRPLRDWALGQTDLLGRLGVPLAPLANAFLGSRRLRSLVQAVAGIHRDAPVPRFAGRTFRAAWRRAGHPLPRPGAAVSVGADGRFPRPDRAVVYFHGCAANYQEPRVAESVVAVLARNGLETIVPDQVCCGLPLISNGYYAEARRKATRNIASLAEWAAAGYRIVTASTSCGHTLKAEYRTMLDLDDPAARSVAGATWDIMEFLADLHESGRLDTQFGSLAGPGGTARPLLYHAPCQLRSQGIGLPALDLLALVPGLEPIDLDHDCCGVAGTYGLKEEKYEVAMAVGAGLFDKIRAVDPARAPAAACDSETCRWQIERATGRPTLHPVEFLAEAYRAAAPSGQRPADGPGPSVDDRPADARGAPPEPGSTASA